MGSMPPRLLLSNLPEILSSALTSLSLSLSLSPSPSHFILSNLSFTHNFFSVSESELEDIVKAGQSMMLPPEVQTQISQDFRVYVLVHTFSAAANRSISL